MSSTASYSAREDLNRNTRQPDFGIAQYDLNRNRAVHLKHTSVSTSESNNFVVNPISSTVQAFI